MKRRMFLKLSAMLGVMAAPVLRLLEKKREYVTRAGHDDILGLRFELPESAGFRVASTKTWCIYKTFEEGNNDWRNKFWIAPVGATHPQVLCCFPMDEKGMFILDVQKDWKFYRV